MHYAVVHWRAKLIVKPRVILCSTMQYNEIACNTIQYNRIQFNNMQYQKGILRPKQAIFACFLELGGSKWAITVLDE